MDLYRYASKNLSFSLLDIATEDLPKDMHNAATKITSLFCLHWIRDQQRAMDNVAKILKPAGEAFLCFAAYAKGYKAYAMAKDDPRWAPYCQVCL